MNVEPLSELPPDALERWLEDRLSGRTAEPPLDARSWESPQDYVDRIRNDGGTTELVPRLEQALRMALGRAVAASADGSTAFDDIIANGADLAGRWRLPGTAHLLFAAAEQRLQSPAADFGSAPLRGVLRALANVQPRGEFADFWRKLWRLDRADLWGSALAGLRASSPREALQELPTAVARNCARGAPDLGIALWSLWKNPEYGVAESEFAACLRSMPPVEQRHCREALLAAGAAEQDVERLYATPVAASEGGKRTWWFARNTTVPTLACSRTAA